MLRGFNQRVRNLVESQRRVQNITTKCYLFGMDKVLRGNKIGSQAMLSAADIVYNLDAVSLDVCINMH